MNSALGEENTPWVSYLYEAVNLVLTERAIQAVN
jgi:hypothetical protein